MALALTCPLSVFAEKDGGAVPAAAAVSSNKISFTAHKKSRTDYLLLVNKTHKLPDDYEAKLDLVTVKNCFGKEFQVERETYAHFTELQADLLKEGIRIELESTYRSVARQKELTEELRLSEGEDYVKKYVAVPGYSEHHTNTTALHYYTRRIVAEDLFFYDTPDRQAIDNLIGAFPINRR